MKFLPTDVDGCFIVDLDLVSDDRGGFARTFCSDEIAEHGLETDLLQCSISLNRLAGTVRGMHRQVPPYTEAKLVRCTRGSIVDVALDMRPDSPTRGRHAMVELTAENRRALYLPPYVFHGFQTLSDDTEILYGMSGRYAPEGEERRRYDDPAFGLRWPREVTAIADKDANAPLWQEGP